MRRRRRFMDPARFAQRAAVEAGLKGAYVYKVPSVGALIDRAVNGKATKGNGLNGERSSRDKESTAAWDGGIGWDGASKLAVRGDIEGARRLHAAMLRVVDAVVTARPRLDPEYRLDGGQWIDVARYVKGEPECWGSMIESEPARGARSVAIVLNAATPGQLQDADIDGVGVQLGGTILGLQSLGYSVTLYWTKKLSGHSARKKHFFLSAPLNPGGAPLDVSMLSVVIRSWFLRRIVFSYYETLEPECRADMGFTSNGGYGSSELMTANEARELTGESNVAVIDTMRFIRNAAGVKDEIINQLTGGK